MQKRCTLFGFGSNDTAHAKGIIDYLKKIFAIDKKFNGNSLHTRLRLTDAMVDVKISCANNEIRVTLVGFADGNYEGHVKGRLQQVQDEIKSYLGGSHAAKWRNKVHVNSCVESYR